MAIEIVEAGIVLSHVPGIYNMLADELSRKNVDRIQAPVWTKEDLNQNEKAKADLLAITTRSNLRGEPVEKQRVSFPLLSNAIRKRFHVPNDSTHIIPYDRIRNSYNNFEYEIKEEEREADGLIFKQVGEADQVIVIPDEDVHLHELLITMAHCTLGGHPNRRLTAIVLSRQFYWKSLKQDAENFVDNCMTCKLTKPPYFNIAPNGIIRTPTGIFSTLGFDIADPGILASNGYRYILVMVDMYSLHLNFRPLRTQEASEVAEQIVHYAANYMAPMELFSDQGKAFISKFTERVAELIGASQFFTFPYVEKSRGQVEASVLMLKKKIRALIADLKAKAVDWPKYLPGAQMAVNNLPSPSLGGLSPNDIIFGTSRPPHAIIIVDVDQERVKNFIEDMSLHVLKKLRDIYKLCYKITNTTKPPIRQYVGTLLAKCMQVSKYTGDEFQDALQVKCLTNYLCSLP